VRSAREILPAVYGCGPRWKTDQELVFSYWRPAAGPQVAAQTRPLSFYRGRLLVEVPDEQWKEQLRALCGVILERINRELGRETVSRIDFRLSRGLPKPPQRAMSAAAPAEGEAGIRDPFLRRLYFASKRQADSQ